MFLTRLPARLLYVTSTDPRYWVSAAWFEPEACAPDVKAPPGRNYFRRLKVRFDWDNSQGPPWWLTRDGACWTPSGVKQSLSAVSEAPVDSPIRTRVNHDHSSDGTAQLAATALKGPGGRDVVNLPSPPLTPERQSDVENLQQALWQGTFAPRKARFDVVNTSEFKSLGKLQESEPGSGSLVNQYAQQPGSKLPE